MNKKEKIIKGFECCTCVDCKGCPYKDGTESTCYQYLMQDAIEYIKNTPSKAEVINDFAERIKCYYNHLKGNTYAGLVAYHVGIVAEETIARECGEDD